MFRTLFLLALIVLAPLAAQGQHQLKVLHAFGTGTDGGGLWSNVVFDKDGNLYGTTSGGGSYGQGIVFELTPGPDGQWAETVLHNFPSSPDDGQGPMGGVILDPAANIYGTTEGGGGPYTYGTVFELTPGLGSWSETTLHRYGLDEDACCPLASMWMDKSGNLFGTAYAVFKLTPGTDGWTETLLPRPDGLGASTGVIMDGMANLYGTVAGGGTYNEGIVYELHPVSVRASVLGEGGGWASRILYQFGGFKNDGKVPSLGQLASDQHGSLYGTTEIGGTTGYGTVFKLSRTP
jgi:uncharacterized repeat protein (TIGR03803 family)